jgi:predicted TPR repeat methyltransferase
MRYTAYLKVPQLVISALRHPSASILDLGCGTGLSSLLFFEKGHQVTGIDGTEAMVRRARKLPYDKVVQQDLESPWRVKDHSFDAVVMVGVVEYIIYPAVLFRRVHSKLVDGGLFGLTVPQKKQMVYRQQAKIVPQKRDRAHYLQGGLQHRGFRDGVGLRGRWRKGVVLELSLAQNFFFEQVATS